jgi:hypothetical protein
MALTAIDLEPKIGSELKVAKTLLDGSNSGRVLHRFTLNGEEPIAA